MIPVMSRMSSLVRATTSSGMSLGLRFAANSASWRVIPVMMLCSLEGLKNWVHVSCVFKLVDLLIH